MKRTQWKRKPTKPLKRGKLKRQSLMPLPKLQRECDKLYQLVGKKLMPHSIVSGKPVEVIHHFYTKQSSSRLRYDMDNGIPLTRGEHFAIHIKSDPEIIARIIERRGQKWYQELSAKRHLPIKVDRLYYQQVLVSLEKKCS